MTDKLDNSAISSECQHTTYHLPQWDENGKCSWNGIPLQHKSLNAEAKCLVPPTKVIPVIFIPGIMGTNLKDTKNGEPVWRADMFMGMDTLYLTNLDGKKRREILNVESTLVDNSGRYMLNVSSPFDDDGNMLPRREERHWGEALFLSYGFFLEVLQSSLMDDWQKDLLNMVKNDDAEKIQNYFNTKGVLSQLVDCPIGGTNETLLTEEELKHFKHFLFSVHVFGYNWLEDNAISAKNLAIYIDEVLKTYRNKHGYGLAIEKVIILTHSMGGLIARYAMNPPEGSFQGCQDKVLGVVHGVIPDLGSPAAYRRMKVGAAQEGIPGKVLGATAKELMSVLAFAPAPLQLLPYPKYKASWLTIEDEGSYPTKVDLTTGKFNPFDEIYLREDVWWRLYEPDILDKDVTTINSNWENYSLLMGDNVKKFMVYQEKGQYHPNTYIFYGTEIESDNYLIWKKEIEGKAYMNPYSGRPYFPEPKENNRRVLRYGEIDSTTALKMGSESGMSYKQFILESSKGSGDGTVPIESLADIIKSPCVKSSFATDVDHQNAYAVDSLDDIKKRYAIQFTLRAIVKMVQEVDIRAAD
ncbi:esterase/lipase family protein [Providencia huashanensis]|uniref:esterase/lipase family protein n=1 Tax=Providencia huashanensis TaxID=3037798 RepID=UPI0040456A4C